jgi:hypothetical protein
MIMSLEEMEEMDSDCFNPKTYTQWRVIFQSHRELSVKLSEIHQSKNLTQQEIRFLKIEIEINLTLKIELIN